MFSGRKVKWNHFGKKYALRISDYELDYADLYDAFMKKVHEVRPDFEGAIAYIDQYGRQVIVNSDKDLRDALNQSKGKLKLHTTLADGQVLSAAEMAGRQTRSHSVPPAVKHLLLRWISQDHLAQSTCNILEYYENFLIMRIIIPRERYPRSNKDTS
ncbi:hypothetical protein ANCCEY_05054 [Ancylostoma ceylanicum]|uniref:PB1 domain-containing protein n=1 Tax=Ancylostoma ceylanicum TaxID=53326 RepID=A0A0D6LXD9_9BILA|nr:hypothetical protein ANCCEY_05054 [Ancylostoma ceylanicum]